MSVSAPVCGRERSRRDVASRVIVPNGGLMRGGACVITVLVLASAPLPAHGQSAAAPSRPATKTWTTPRTADGRPDLQGVWLIHTATPLERPKALEGRSTLTGTCATILTIVTSGVR